MTDLSAEAREILESGRVAMMPSDAVRGRVREGVAARVAAGPAIAGAAGGSALKLVLLAGVAIGAVVVAGVVIARQGGGGSSAQAPAAEPVSTAAPDVSLPPPAPTVEELAPEVPGPVPAPAPAVRSSVPRRPATGPRLAAEVALLEEARAALRTGTPAAAIAALDRHRKEIEAPQLEREALLLRAEALCGAGDRVAGERALEEVGRRWPGASGVEAVRTRCAR
jgi:hypothetical protein